ncbi:O-antigen ligase family protein [candidate division WOR-3 bacterium]|nr:O-antigen ligase family protein [candidate division WOR-3 bacterium]
MINNSSIVPFKEAKTISLIEKSSLIVFIFFELLFLFFFAFGKTQYFLAGIIGAVTILLILFKPKIGLLLPLVILYSGITVFIPGIYFPVVIILLFGIMISWMVSTQVPIHISKQDSLIFLLITMITFSFLYSTDIHRGLYALREFIKALVIYFIIVNIVNSKKLLVAIIWTIVISTAFASFFSIYQYIAGSIFEFSVFKIYYRVAGTGNDANYFALLLVTTLPLSLSLFRITRFKLLKILLLIISFAYIFSIFFTLSRGGLIGLSFVLIFFLFKFRTNKKIFILLLFVILFLSFFIPLNVKMRIQTLIHFQGDASIIQRIELIKGGLRVFAESPLVGVGLGGFINHVARYVTMPMVAHNTYLQVAAELGLIGFSLFASIILLTLWTLHKNQKMLKESGKRELFFISQSLQGGLLGFLVISAFLSVPFHFSLWIMISLSVVLNKLTVKSFIT